MDGDELAERTPEPPATDVAERQGAMPPSATVVLDPSGNEYKRALDEHRVTCEHVNQFRDLRFKQLTLFTALTTALMISRSVPSSSAISPLLGIVLTVCFYALEWRSTVCRKKYAERLRELEDKLGFEEFKRAKLSPLWSSMIPTSLLFIAVLAAWILAAQK